MKKLTAAVLTGALFTTMSTTAFAAGVPSSQQIDVEAKYSDTSTSPKVYSVDVEWGKMEFTYSKSGTRIWNADSHTFTENTAAAWTGDGNTLKVTNHSNQGVNVSFAFAKENAIADSITGSFDVASKQLSAGAENDAVNADNVTATLSLSGTLASSRTAFTKVGGITVTLTENRV